MTQDVLIPDIGDFSDVPVVEIAVAVGDVVEIDDPLMMLESDKATLDIPAPFAGRVTEILVTVGDMVSQGTAVLRIDAEASDPPRPDDAKASAASPPAAAEADIHAPLVVIGAGPGGYTAAFRAADLGKDVVLIERWDTLGGVCLNVGCIPSKALLHMAKVLEETRDLSAHGLIFEEQRLDLDAVRAWKDGVIGKLTGGLNGLAKRRKVRVLHGDASFTSPNSLSIEGPDGQQSLSFDQAIIAVGSEPVRLPFLPEDPRIIDSTGALELEDIPDRLLVIGGGIIGLEMAQVYDAFGARVEVVELMDQLIPGADRDIVAPLTKRISDRYSAIRTGTKVTAVEAGSELTVTFEGPNGSETAKYDRILVAVGRTPNGGKINAEAAGLTRDGPGFISVDKQMRTKQSHIFAIGDVVGQPMLAHKAVHEGKVAAEVACGERVAFEPAAIPSVAYTDPEVAWVGLTEATAKAKDIKYKKGAFPWAASGRSLALGRDEGITKILFDPETGKLLGAGIVGPNAGDLIAEVGLALEMGADAEDLSLSIHPHPTLSETVALAAEAYAGTITDL